MNIFERSKNQPFDDESKVITEHLLYANENKTKKIKEKILKLKPEEIGILIRIISGHNNLNYHLERIGYSYTDQCEYCQDPEYPDANNIETQETALHILCECPYFITIRRDIYQENYLKLNNMFPKNKQMKNIRKLITFFKKTKVFERESKLSKRDISPNRTNKRKREPKKETEQQQKKRKITTVYASRQELTTFYKQNLKYGKHREFFKKCTYKSKNK